MRRRSLSPAQIRFFRISPSNLHFSSNTTAQQLLQESLIEISPNQSFQTSQHCALDLSKISKNSSGNFESTVNNFGILINKNFGYDSIEHRVQVFGNQVKQIQKVMLKNQKDNKGKQNALDAKIKQISDVRVKLDASSTYSNFSFNLTLQSFELKSVHAEHNSQLPIQYLRLLTTHVSSSELIQYVSNSIKTQGNQLIVDYDRIYTRVRNMKNTQIQYQKQQFNFQKYGYQLVLQVPILTLQCNQLQFSSKILIQNVDMMKIVDSNFSNVDSILDKYLDKISVNNVIMEKQKEQEQNNSKTVE